MSIQAFVKFFGSAANRTSCTANVAKVVAESGCNWACTYPAGRRPRQPKDGDVMFMARLVNEPNDIVVFGQAIGHEHDDERDVASAAEIKRRPWKKRWSNYIRVSDARFIDADVGDGVALSELMDALGSDSFTSTQANARKGRGNTDPRQSLSQKPHIRLTRKAHAWLQDRMDERLERHGIVDTRDAKYAAPTS